MAIIGLRMTGDQRPPAGEIILYQTADGTTRIECRFVEETLWLSQALIAELFQITVPTANGHLRNVYAEGELPTDRTIREFRIVRREGTREVSREVDHKRRRIAASGAPIRRARV